MVFLIFEIFLKYLLSQSPDHLIRDDTHSAAGGPQLYPYPYPEDLIAVKHFQLSNMLGV